MRPGLQKSVSAAGSLQFRRALGLVLPLLLILSTGVEPGLHAQIDLVTPDTVYVGVTRLGNCDTVEIPVRNDGTRRVRLLQRSLTPGSNAIRLPGSTIDTIGIGPAETRLLRLVYCPDSTDCSLTRLQMTFVEDSTIARAIRAIVVRTCAGRPVMRATPQFIDFGEVDAGECRWRRIAIANVGDYPARVDEAAIANGPFSIRSGPELPITLQPTESAEFLLQFCPTQEITAVDSLHFRERSTNDGVVLYLTGTSPPEIESLPPTVPALIEMRPILFGLCRDTTIVIENTGSDTLRIDDIIRSHPTTSVLAPNLPVILPPGGSNEVLVRICPDTAGSFEMHLLYRFGGTTLAESRLTGRTVTPMVWIDTVRTDASTIARMSVNVWPQELLAELPTGLPFSLTFLVDKTALLPRSVLSSSGSLTLTTIGSGSYRIYGENLQIGKGALGQIDVLGLSSGRHENRLEPTAFTFLDEQIRWRYENGLILLDGCDIDRLPPLGRPAALLSLGPNPSASDIRIDYHLPTDYPGLLEIYDARGRVVRQRVLPAGDGSPGLVRIDIALLPRGLYMVALTERNERDHRLLRIE